MKSDYYLNFEDKFRGSRENIIKRLSIYDSLIDLFIQKNNEIRLLDIGCGRGEWLEKCKDKIPNAVGIDQDLNMINLCKSLGLNVIHGKAIDTLSSLDSGSISIITIFHMIEHIENEELSLLIEKCHRVLSDDGILIIETPSIDNLLVSTKLFYMDSTHINHINPDRITYEIESLGFEKAVYYYINGGPLKNASSLKLTRLLNGVAQDLLIVACKGKINSDLLFNNHLEWQSDLCQAPSTLEAATNFDCEIERLFKEQRTFKDEQGNFNYGQIKLNNEQKTFNDEQIILNNEQRNLNKEQRTFKDEQGNFNYGQIKLNNEQKTFNNDQETFKHEQIILNNEQMKLSNEQITLNNEQRKIITDLNNEILFFKERLNLFENRQLTIYKLLSPIIKFGKYFKKIIIYICSKTFSIMINYRITRIILNTKLMLSLIRICFKVLPLETSNISLEKVYYALHKVKQIDKKSMSFNHKLLKHYNNSESAVQLKNLLIKRIFRKLK